MNLENNGTVLFRKKYCILVYDEQTKCLYQHWIGFLNSRQFKKGYLKTTKYFKKYEISSIISNTKYLLVIGEKEINWVVRYINPILLENGLKQMAFVMPDSIFTKWSVENYTEKSKNVFEIQYFSSMERAVKWIKKEVISNTPSTSNMLCY